MLQIRRRLTLGIWWGHSDLLYPSATWEPLTPAALNPFSTADAAEAFKELDLCVKTWGAQLIGLDAYAFSSREAVVWMRKLRSNYPHVMFITERALPDFPHVLAPTFITQADLPDGLISDPFWIIKYLNPGSEYIVQVDQLGTVTDSDRADQLAADGLTMLTSWTNPVRAGLRAISQHRLLGESTIPHFTSAFQATPLGAAQGSML